MREPPKANLTLAKEQTSINQGRLGCLNSFEIYIYIYIYIYIIFLCFINLINGQLLFLSSPSQIKVR
ncbi:Uncharacterized protein TCM_001051 [Theobroma cacao]|uniref:Uncharacterized protein n=1 Tax=Theobroma cacao TaxID=3641 RepID=A0A061DPZ7_THECC|nr:Uncharacterized protein TCM_001051 [Theobroma cacao]